MNFTYELSFYIKMDVIYIKSGFEDFIKFVIKTSKIFSNII
jgi:hypothetical protein